MNKTIPVIAIDGPSGAGKGVITQRLAAYKGYHLLDSGAIYRLVGFAARKNGVDLSNRSGLLELAQGLDVSFYVTGDSENPLSIWYRNEDVTRDLRTNEAGVDASEVASIGELRLAMRGLQRSFKKSPSLVADGRDMGTVVFNEAKVKIFLTASLEARAQRRYVELYKHDKKISFKTILEQIRERDQRDQTRSSSPMIAASDAKIFDTSDLSINEAVDEVYFYIQTKI